MWATVIAVLGTLAGTGLASVTQHLMGRRTERQQHRQEVTAVVADLMGAILTYRERHWLLIAALREGAAETAGDRALRYAARSAVTRAIDRLALTTNDRGLLTTGSAAAWSAITLSDITVGEATGGRFSEETETALDAGRERSRDAHTAFRETAATYIHGR